MSLDYFLEQIEIEREWREAEIRFLDNNQRALNEEDQKIIRRSILCLLYAHIEGFVKFSFSLYIDEINKKKLTCSEVRPAFAAAAFHTEFKALRNNEKKSKLFKKKKPQDVHLHRLSREIEFIENINEYFDYPVNIPEEFINTENNVGQQVIEKLLFQIGIDHEGLKPIYSPLTRLLNVRNDISHGKRKSGIDDKEYQEFLSCFNSVVSSISHRLTTAFGRKEFLAS